MLIGIAGFHLFGDKIKMKKYELLHKRYLTSNFFESTEELDEGYTWDRIKHGIRNALDPVYDFKNEWFGTFYKNNVTEADNHLKKCIKENDEFNELLNFQTDDYVFTGRINNLEVLNERKLIESLLSESDEEDLAALEKELADKEAKIKALKTKINMRGADEDNYQVSGTDYDPADQDTESEEDYTIDVYNNETQLKLSGKGEYVTITNPTKEELFKQFPVLSKHYKVYNNLLTVIAKKVSMMFKYGLKSEPTEGVLEEKIEPDNILNKCFKFDLYVRYEAKDKKKASLKKIDDKTDEGILPIIAHEMEKGDDINSGVLKMYNKTWTFELEVYNSDSIINYEKSLLSNESESKEYRKIVGELIFSYKNKKEKTLKNLSKYKKITIADEKKDNISKELKDFLNTSELYFSKYENVLNEEADTIENYMMELESAIKDKLFDKIDRIVPVETEGKENYRNKEINEDLKTYINQIIYDTKDFLIDIKETKQRFSDLKKDVEDKITVETEEQIRNRARKDIIKWLSLNKAKAEDIKEDPTHGDIIYSKDLLCGRRDDPLSVETHFEIIVSSMSGEL